MRIALCSDEPYPVHQEIREELLARSHVVVPFGAVQTGEEEPWAEAAEAAAQAVVSGDCQEAILLCWTGTGVSIAANKIPGIRAALCGDPGTAAGARVWNHANILCLSNRTLSGDMAREILRAWFDTDKGSQGAAGVEGLRDMERRNLGLAPSR